VSCAALVAVACSGFGGAASAQSLADTMVAAYLNSPDLAAGRADVKVSGERAVQARSGGRVHVDGELNAAAFTRNNTKSKSALAGKSVTTVRVPNFPTSVALAVTQPLYTGGQVANATEAAETRISEQETVLTATEQQVLLDAVTAYLDVRRDEEFVSLGRNNVRVLTEQLRAARERFEVGEVTRTDVEQARSRMAASQSSLAAAKGALQNSRESYNRAVGSYPGELQPPPPLPDMPTSQDEAVAMALRDDPGVIRSRLEREASGSDVRAAMGALLPQVSLQGRVTAAETFGDGAGTPDSAQVGIVVTVPIFSGGSNYSRVREAQAFAERASADIDSAIRTAVRNVGVAWSSLEVARASIQARQLQVSAAQLAFEGVREEAKVGARTTLDVLDAEQELLNARASLVEARRNEQVAAYSVLASVGKMTVAHLGLDVGDTGEVAKYYHSVRHRNFGYDPSDDTVWRTKWRP